MIKRSRFIILLFFIVYTVSLGFFYMKYVPLIKSFQFLLAPILAIVAVFTAWRVKIGILLFVFSFPLINILPYFFGIYEDTPHAPAALVLFLFFFLGWVVHQVLFPSRFSFNYSILKPIAFFSVLIVLSGVITFLRYANFFPFISDHIYEFTVNVNGVTSGGAITGILFNSLNYLTGFIFFFILLTEVDSMRYKRRILIALFGSAFISLSFGLIQNFADLSFGNTPLRTLLHTANATFKDPNSFGVFLAVLIPFLLCMVIFIKTWIRLLFAAMFACALFLLPLTGSMSSMFTVVLSFVILMILLSRMIFYVKRSDRKAVKRVKALIVVSLLFVGIFVSSFFILKDPITLIRLKKRTEYIEKEGNWDLFSGRRLSYFWDLAGRMMKDYPISGVGIGAYIVELPNYAEMHQKKWRLSDSAENYFFQTGSELGFAGLLLSLWIFFEIFRKIAEYLGRALRTERYEYVGIGITTGIIVFFSSFMLHTYIGSFEIKYLFWLYVSLVFFLGRQSDIEEKKIRVTKKLRIFGTAVIVLFCATLLWHSTHSLSLESRTGRFHFVQEFGFGKLEKTEGGREFRWTEKNAGIALKIDKPLIKIPILASHPDIRENPVTLRIYIIKDFFRQKRELDEIRIDQDVWKLYEYDLSEELDQNVLFLFKVSRTWNPLKEVGTQDARNLGVAIGKITFEDQPIL